MTQDPIIPCRECDGIEFHSSRCSIGVNKLSLSREPIDTSTMKPIKFPPPENIAVSYADAFYEIAAMLNIPAQDQSPKHVWLTQMKPELMRRLYS